MLHHGDGLTAGEIAWALDLAEGTVENQLAAFHRRARQILEGTADGSH
jgi:DNA-directed RNA polymerase specialized sigma24 family protein